MEANDRISQRNKGYRRARTIMKSKLIFLRPYLVLLFLGLIIYVPITFHASQFPVDFGKHIDAALALQTSQTYVNRVLYHAVFLVVHRLLPDASLPLTAVVAIQLFMLPVPLIAFAFFKAAASRRLPDALLMTFALGLTVMAPVTLWANPCMIGYFNPIVYHNTTLIALRLFIIPVSLLAVRGFYQPSFKSKNRQVIMTMLCAVLVLLATFTKPSYTFVIVPGCCIFAAWQLLERRYVNYSFLILGVCLPGVIMLGALYLLANVSFDDGTTIAIGVFRFMNLYVPAWRIPIQLIMSVIFPMGLYVLYRKEARKDLYLNLSWVTFALASAMAYLLYEAGPRLSHGNFAWSGHNAVFVLMFASILFFCRTFAISPQTHRRTVLQLLGVGLTGREVFVLLLFSLHVGSGIAYYFRFLGATSLP